MKKRIRLIASFCFVFLFLVWTALVCLVDIRPIGPLNSSVGLATINGYAQRLLGTSMVLYEVTDWLSILPLAIVLGFGILGMKQWIKRKHILKVDRDILALGGFYIAVLAMFLLFEKLDVNFRPVLIEGKLEASYPSSTTMLALCVLPTAALQLNRRIRPKFFRSCVKWMLILLTVFMITARVLSGVHWITDIVGGILLSGGLVFAYLYFSE